MLGIGLSSFIWEGGVDLVVFCVEGFWERVCWWCGGGEDVGVRCGRSGRGEVGKLYGVLVSDDLLWV